MDQSRTASCIAKSLTGQMSEETERHEGRKGVGNGEMAAVNRGVDGQPSSGHLNAEQKWLGKLWRCTGSAVALAGRTFGVSTTCCRYRLVEEQRADRRSPDRAEEGVVCLGLRPLFSLRDVRGHRWAHERVLRITVQA